MGMGTVVTAARREGRQAQVRGSTACGRADGSTRVPSSSCSPGSCSAASPAGGWLHVWAAKRRADGRLIAFRRDPLAFTQQPEALVAQALTWHRRGLEVFAGLLPRTAPRPDNGAVGEGALLWADVDGKDSLGELAAFCDEHPAHYLTASGGGGRHAAWLLGEPRPAAELADACRRLAVAVGGDLAVCHPGASLRLPGTRNGKPGAGPCELLAADLALAPYEL